MKITGIRSMRLFGPLVHGQGGETGGSIGKVVVRVDTDAGIYGLGEADDFMGVREAHRVRASLLPRPRPVRRHRRSSRNSCGRRCRRTRRTRRPGRAATTSSWSPPRRPTAIPQGPVVWAASAIDTALVDLIGKALGVPAYTLLGGKFRDRIRIYLDRSSPVDVENLDAWRAMARGRGGRRASRRRSSTSTTSRRTSVPDIWNRSLSLAQINRMVERLAVVRDVVGPDFELCVDLHRQYNVPDAIRVAQRARAAEPPLARRPDDRHRTSTPTSPSRRQSRSPCASARCSSPSSSASSSTTARSTSSTPTCCSAAACTSCAGSPTTPTCTGCRSRCTATAARSRPSRRRTSRPPAATSWGSSTTSSRRHG